jgi:hypothetical protein
MVERVKSGRNIRIGGAIISSSRCLITLPSVQLYIFKASNITEKFIVESIKLSD